MSRAGDLNFAKMHLKDALQYAKSGGAPRTADKIRSAIKSIDGALRHEAGDESRARRQAEKKWPGYTPEAQAYEQRTRVVPGVCNTCEKFTDNCTCDTICETCGDLRSRCTGDNV